jgi:hypothetical protein
MGRNRPIRTKKSFRRVLAAALDQGQREFEKEFWHKLEITAAQISTSITLLLSMTQRCAKTNGG